MAYFRDSGSHAKLVETLNMLRNKVFKAAGPLLQKANADSSLKSSGMFFFGQLMLKWKCIPVVRDHPGSCIFELCNKVN